MLRDLLSESLFLVCLITGLEGLYWEGVPRLNKHREHLGSGFLPESKRFIASMRKSVWRHMNFV